MICSCGGQTTIKHATTAGAILAYARCGCCGRCDNYVLHVASQRVATGRTARKVFSDPNAIEQIRRRLNNK